MPLHLNRDSILSGASYVAPEGALEPLVAKIWATALTLDRVGRNDDFFDLGGDSLTALAISDAIARELHLEMRTHIFIRTPTLASFARTLQGDHEREPRMGTAVDGTGAETRGPPMNDPIDISVAFHASPEQSKANTGAVVLGSGNGHVPTVRAFAEHGIAAIQVRLIRDNEHHLDRLRRYATYDESGVVRCQRAMTHLQETNDVDEFILYGNCALANICFNTALADTRVSGLILLNPRLSGVQPGFLFRLRLHLFRPRSWLRLLRGDMRLSRSIRENKSAPAPAPEPDSGGSYFKDMALPGDVDQQLLRLTTSRNLRVLLLFTRAEPSLAHFRRFFRKSLKKPIAAGQVRVAVLDTDSHDPLSTHDDSASALNALIVDWTTRLRADG